MDIAKFLVKDLLKERVHKFDDKPEHNASWKDTFHRIVWDYTYDSYACVQEFMIIRVSRQIDQRLAVFLVINVYFNKY
jgi:hypothetical protein